ncbi:hypothetical protein C8Q76DRAFT_791308 [Earliella scabrosa]|nr:hypothetical protein C8Q76DRAFT_791308 [Earliella scabrosa]
MAQVAGFAQMFLLRGRAGVMMAELYYLLFDAALFNPSKIGHGPEGYFFAENGEHSLHALARAVGDALVAVGRATEAEPNEFTPEERLKYFGSEFAANLNFTNARVRADRARRDWAPRYTTEDMLKSAREEVEDLVKKQAAAAWELSA